MKINEIIKTKRVELKLTQAQVAVYLGVSTPSVNKWEKGVTYPDIMLLPALARLLKTDLNTLLSFQDNLSDQEIEIFLNDVVSMAEKALLADVFSFVQEKIKQFPSCASLLFYAAGVLRGIQVEKANTHKEYEDLIVSYYERVIQLDDIKYIEKAKEMVVHIYMQNKDFAKAELLLLQMAQQSSIDIKQLQVKLYLAKDQLKEAQHIQEECLLQAGNEIYHKLLYLLDIAIKDERMEDALYIANVNSECAKLFDLWEYNIYLPKLEYYTKSKQKTQAVKSLLGLLKTFDKPWRVNASPLYQTIQTKQSSLKFYSSMKKKIMQSVMEDPQTAFFSDDPMLQPYKEEILKEEIMETLDI